MRLNFLSNKLVFSGVVLILLVILITLTKIAFAPTNNLPTKNTAPIPANYTSNIFKYDTQKAEKLLTQYIKDTVKPEFLPAKIEVKQGLSSAGNIGNIKYQFGFFSNSKENTISAEFVYKENTNAPNAYGIFIQPNGTTEATATASLANKLLSSYFTNPYSISNCQAKGTTSYCENFQALNEGNRSYGITLSKNGPNSMLRIISCFVPKDSQFYTKLKSCISL